MNADRRSKKTMRKITRMEPYTAKREAIDAIRRLPDDVALDEIVYRIYVLNQLRQGLQDVEAGRCVSSATLARDVERWSIANG